MLHIVVINKKIDVCVCAVSLQLSGARSELTALLAEQAAHQAHMDSLDNLALKTRFMAKLQDIAAAISHKKQQVGKPVSIDKTLLFIISTDARPVHILFVARCSFSEA